MDNGCWWDLLADPTPACAGFVDPASQCSMFDGNSIYCAAHMDCSWDATGSVCLPNTPPPTGCAAYTSGYYTCNQDPTCYYSTPDCVDYVSGTTSCDVFNADMDGCNVHSADCMWNGMTCVPNGSCASFNQSLCEGDSACTWTGTFCTDCSASPQFELGCACASGTDCISGSCDGTCISGGGSGCDMLDMNSCKADHTCSWNIVACESCPASGLQPDGCTCVSPGDCQSGLTCIDMFCQPIPVGCAANPSDTSCNIDGACWWDAAANLGAGACVNFVDPGTQCSTFDGFSSYCSAHTGCIWDGISSCNPVGGGCSANPSDTSCNIDASCWWDAAANGGAGLCVNFVDPASQCSTFDGNISYCNVHTACMWDGISSCNPIGGGGCAAFNGQETNCNNDINCNYNIPEALCFDNLGACGDYTNSFQCDADGAKNCIWDGTACTVSCADDNGCAPGSYCNTPIDAFCVPCSNLDGMMSTCNGHSTQCVWNSPLSQCDPIGGGSGCSILDNSGCTADHTCWWQISPTQECMTCPMTGPFPIGCYCASSIDCASNNCGVGGFCEQPVVGCAANMSDTTCNMDAACWWDINAIPNPACVNFVDPMTQCSAFNGFSSYCAVHTSCTWNGISSCDPIGGGCSGYTGSTACDSDMACNWNVSTNMCYNDMMSCIDYTIGDACNADIAKNCAWNGTSCIISGGGCAGYTGSTACDSDMACNWNVSTNMCYNDMMSCFDYTIGDACNADIAKNCAWDGMACGVACASDTECTTYGTACNFGGSPPTCVPCSTFDFQSSMCMGHSSNCLWNPTPQTCTPAP